jgi:hypothetical protein
MQELSKRVVFLALNANVFLFYRDPILLKFCSFCTAIVFTRFFSSSFLWNRPFEV